MNRYPARTPVDAENLLRGLNLVMQAADATGADRQAIISASIRFLGEQGGIGLDMWSADLDPVHLLQSKVGDVMRAVAAVGLTHEFPVPIIKRYVEPLRKLLDLGDDDDEDVLEPGPPRPLRSPAPPRLG